MADNVWRGSEASVILARFAALGLNDAAKYLLELSQPLVPERTDALEKSGTVYKTNEHELASQVQYHEFYAVWQHEKLNYHHKHGQAKYLEAPLVEHGHTLALLVAMEIRKGL